MSANDLDAGTGGGGEPREFVFAFGWLVGVVDDDDVGCAGLERLFCPLVAGDPKVAFFDFADEDIGGGLGFVVFDLEKELFDGPPDVFEAGTDVDVEVALFGAAGEGFGKRLAEEVDGGFVAGDDEARCVLLFAELFDEPGGFFGEFAAVVLDVAAEAVLVHAAGGAHLIVVGVFVLPGYFAGPLATDDEEAEGVGIGDGDDGGFVFVEQTGELVEPGVAVVDDRVFERCWGGDEFEEAGS